jgi:Blastomyces yeast-phase-specific protein
MRNSITILAAVSSLSSLASAVGNAVVLNNCAFPVYVWSVDSTVSQEYTINQGQSYSEVLHSDPTTGGVAIKITTVEDGLYNSSPETIYAYSLTNGEVWYDLSDVFGDPFSGSPLTVTPSDASCGTISWPDGVSPTGSQVNVCEDAANITLTLC